MIACGCNFRVPTSILDIVHLVYGVTISFLKIVFLARCDAGKSVIPESGVKVPISGPNGSQAGDLNQNLHRQVL